MTIRALVEDPLEPGIQSEFPLVISRELEVIGHPIAIGEGKIGGGGSILKIRTLGGNIVIRKSRQTQ